MLYHVVRGGPTRKVILTCISAVITCRSPKFITKKNLSSVSGAPALPFCLYLSSHTSFSPPPLNTPPLLHPLSDQFDLLEWASVFNCFCVQCFDNEARHLDTSTDTAETVSNPLQLLLPENLLMVFSQMFLHFVQTAQQQTYGVSGRMGHMHANIFLFWDFMCDINQEKQRLSLNSNVFARSKKGSVLSTLHHFMPVIPLLFFCKLCGTKQTWRAR